MIWAGPAFDLPFSIVWRTEGGIPIAHDIEGQVEIAVDRDGDWFILSIQNSDGEHIPNYEPEWRMLELMIDRQCRDSIEHAVYEFEIETRGRAVAG